MKRTIQMIHKEESEWFVTITCETVKNGYAPEYSEATKTVTYDAPTAATETIRSNEPGPAQDQFYSWIGQYHFRGYSISHSQVTK